MKNREKIALVFVIAILLRISFLAILIRNHTSDEAFKLKPDTWGYTCAAKYLIGVGYGSEDCVLFRGIGYPLFIDLCYLLFGYSAWPILFIQAVLSSLGCVLIFLTAREVLEKYAYADLIAGLIAAFSLTSISLSVAVLSDTLSHVLIVTSVFLTLRGIKNNSLAHFCLVGLITGYATLVRITNTFWPWAILCAVLFASKGCFPFPKGEIVRKCLVMVLISMVVVSGWSARNYLKHGVFAPATVGVHTALFYLAAPSIADGMKEGRGIGELLSLRVDIGEVKAVRLDMGKELGYNESSWFGDGGSKYGKNLGYFSSIFRSNPAMMAYTLVKNAFINVLDIDYIHRDVISLTRQEQVRNQVLLGRVSLLVFLSFWSGLAVFFWRPKDFRMLLLIAMYLYFALMSGVSIWQGSRLFFPAQTSWIIIVSGTAERTLDCLKRYFRRS